MSPRDAGRLARRFGVQLYDGDAAPAPARWCLEFIPADGAPVVAHRRADTPAELRARCRRAHNRAVMLRASRGAPDDAA